jgi:hypothetical protein
MIHISWPGNPRLTKKKLEFFCRVRLNDCQIKSILWRRYRVDLGILTVICNTTLGANSSSKAEE